MSVLTLGKYLERIQVTQADFAKSVGRSPQIVSHWVKSNARVDMTDYGIRVSLEKVVYETQVAK